jgi:hypothetical protein
MPLNKITRNIFAVAAAAAIRRPMNQLSPCPSPLQSREDRTATKRWTNMRFLLLTLSALLWCGVSGAQESTLKDNLDLRWSKGDLPPVVFGAEHTKFVEIISGGEDLLQQCLADKELWSQDSLVFRLAHAHASKIVSCRENHSPSTHVIFEFAGETDVLRKACVHLDGHGAQTLTSRIEHFGEFAFHKVTFQGNNQNRMNDNLAWSLFQPIRLTPEQLPPLTKRDRFRLFTAKTLTKTQPYVSSAMAAGFSQFFSPNNIWGRGGDKFANRFEASFVQRLVTYGMQDGFAAAFHEDLRYRPSLENGVFQRLRYAVARTFILQTPRGNEVAFANLAAAFSSGLIINVCHPGRENFLHPGAWTLAGGNLLGFMESNLWAEFKPDIRHLVRSKILHRQ